VVLLAGAAVMAACTSNPAAAPNSSAAGPGAATGPESAAPTAASLIDDSQLTADLAGVTQRKVATVAPTRLATGLVPPTNRWFSGLVFGPQPQPVFPMPLSVALTDKEIALGLPQVTPSAKTIMGGNNPQIHLPLGAAKMQVTAYDTLTVTATYSSAAGSALGSVLLAQGSPFVTYTAATAQTIPVEPVFKQQPGGVYTSTVAGHEYALVVGAGATVDTAGKVSLTPGSTLTVYATPDKATAASLAAAAANPVIGGSVTHSTVGNVVDTTLHYKTRNDAATMISPMAGQKIVGGTVAGGSYPSIYGTMPLYSGTSVTTSVPLATPSGALDLSKLSAADKATVVTQIRKDAAAIDFSADDTYFGGKYLYRAANLMTLAEQLGVTDVAKSLRTKLTAQLTMWFDPKGCATRSDRCFVYDPAIHSMIGLKASFGSDQMNDHHFHYGYMLYAAAVVAKNDPALAKKIAPVVDLIAADIASPQASVNFPQYRNFDPYSGHSWASGTSPFADGNNQESSSEAVNAWNGLALWEQVRGNAGGYDEARWMMSVESDSAKLYWTNTDLSAFPEFTGKIVALNWGGKRDYATWFSPDPGAMLGIQLIPMGPYAQYLAGDNARITANLAEAAPTGYGVEFGEYMVQYLALADPAAARSQLGSLPTTIDNGTTKSYVLAWVLSRSGGGSSS
jgi:endoglucanase Acf2